MAWIRVMLAVALTVTAVLLQLTVLPLLHLPGAVPNVVTVTVIAIGLCAGSVRGAIVGFLAGMLIDLAPPSIATLGITALVLVLAGFAAGLFGQDPDRPLFLICGFSSLTCALTVLAGTLVAGIVGDPHVTWSRVPGILVSELIYGALLAVAIVPLVTWLWARVAPPTGRKP
jgi:rod shape-determining protein MreD